MLKYARAGVSCEAAGGAGERSALKQGLRVFQKLSVPQKQRVEEGVTY